MNWHNLVKNKCPKCGKSINWGTEVGIYCPKCDFKISAKRYDEIVSNMIVNNSKNEKDNWDDDDVMF